MPILPASTSVTALSTPSTPQLEALPVHPVLARAAPIGVFDSGIGGLSVLRALRQTLPHENFVYLADSEQAPYGERESGFILARSLDITQHLLTRHSIKALVVACNTATAAAIETLRNTYPSLPIVGLEPALKPAIALSQTRRIGVAATRGTLESGKFKRLLDRLSPDAEFVLQPCDGLALALERSVAPEHSRTQTQASQNEIERLIDQHVSAMGEFGSGPGQIDTLVLGCTHYPFAEHAFQQRVGPEVQLLETGLPVARHTQRLLHSLDLLQPAQQPAGQLTFSSTGNPKALSAAAQWWLKLTSVQVEKAHKL